MGIKRIVDVQFWNDDKVLEYFSPEDKLFMLYLMTNPHTTQLGIYPINKKHMSFELGYTIDVINVLLDRFENKYEMIRYSNDTKEMAIKNYLKHSIIKGGKPVEDCLMKEIKQVKDKSLLSYVYSNIKDCETLNDTVKKVIETFNEYEINNKKENDNDNDNEESLYESYNESLNIPYKEIIDYLNNKTGSNYRYSTKKTKDLIKARFNEDFTLTDFKIVIDKKSVEWMNTDMQQYLRPETLFGTKFESYLNQQVNNKPQRNYKPQIRKEIVPEWMDKNIQASELTQAEQEEMDNTLKGIIVDQERVERLKERLGTK